MKLINILLATSMVVGLYRLFSSSPALAAAPKGLILDQGMASWYGPGFDGKATANGETFDQRAMTAAHKTLKFGTVVDVVDVDTGKSVRVRINDRGPFVAGRVIDLSSGAAEVLGLKQKGLARVEVRAAV